MRCITLRQPWATLVAIGAKRLETRSWAPRSLRPGDRLAIHASKGFPRGARALCDDEPFASVLWRAGSGNWRELPLGCVIATVRFDKVLPTDALAGEGLSAEEYAFGNYAPGRFAWFLSDPQCVVPPVPAKGGLGLWNWTPPRSGEEPSS